MLILIAKELGFTFSVFLRQTCTAHIQYDAILQIATLRQVENYTGSFPVELLLSQACFPLPSFFVIAFLRHVLEPVKHT